MQDINWAYEILSDSVKRSEYDRMRPANRSRSDNHRADTSTPAGPSNASQGQPAREEAHHHPSSSTAPHAQSREERTILQRYWLLIIAAVISASVLLFRLSTDKPAIQGTNTEINQAGSTSATQQHSAYADCIDWTATQFYDGQTECVLGRILVVTYEFDEPSRADVWRAHFSLNPDTDFTLVSVDRDISQWQGQCVVVYGTLFERDRITEFAKNPQPSMIDSDPYDENGFSILPASAAECD